MEIEVLKEVIEIAKYKSINKAAEVLNMSQPNLSRDIKRLEDELNYSVFKRTNKGVVLTKEGEEFLAFASDILHNVDSIKNITVNESYSQNFSVAVPKAIYISKAFMKFVETLDKNEKMNIEFKEVAALGAIDEIMLNNFDLGIIRFPKEYMSIVANSLVTKNLELEEISLFRNIVLLSNDDPLAKKKCITKEDLASYIELSHGESYFGLGAVDHKHAETNKVIKVYESMGQLTMIKQFTHSFIIAYPLEQSVLDKYGLVQKDVDGISVDCCDALIYKKNYHMSFLDKKFIAYLKYYLHN